MIGVRLVVPIDLKHRNRLEAYYELNMVLSPRGRGECP